MNYVKHPFIIDKCHENLPDGLRLGNYSCVDQYMNGLNKDESLYGPDYMHNNTLANTLSTSDKSRDAWKYSSAGGDGDFPFVGEISSYKGDGFRTELIVDRKTATDTLQELRDNLWIDRQTRAIFIEFITYNANSNLFSFVTLWIELPVTGGFLVGGDTAGIRVYATGFTGVFMRVMEVAFLVLLVVNIALSVYQIRIERSLVSCIRQPRIIIDLLLFHLSLLLIVFFTVRYCTTTNLVNRIKGNVVHFIPFQRAIFFHELFLYFLAFAIAVAFFKLIILLRLMERIAKLGTSLKHASRNLMPILFSFILIILIYAMIGYLSFHHDNKAYRTYHTSIEMLLGLSLGEVKGMEGLLSNAKPELQVYVITFVLAAQFFMINVLISVIIDSHEMFKHKSALQPTDHELVDEIFTQVRKTMKKAVKRYTELQA